MATHSIAQRRETEKATSRKIHAELNDLDKFFKVAGLQTAPSRKRTISFKATLIQTRGYKFDREEANAR